MEINNDRALCRPVLCCLYLFADKNPPCPGGDATSIHFGNAICVLGALVLGGVWGGLGGAVGMTSAIFLILFMSSTHPKPLS